MSTGFDICDIEQAALSLMMEPRGEEDRTDAALNLKAEYFGDPANQIIFQTIMDLWNEKSGIDLLLVTDALRKNGKLETIGGVCYISHVYWQGAPGMMTHYVNRILEEHERRSCVEICQETIVAAPNNPQILSDTVSNLSEITVRRLQETSLADAIHEKLERMQTGQPDEDIILTGLAVLDKESPLHKGDMPLITGQRKSGKSVLALTIVENVCRRGVPVLYFSLEDRKSKVMDRLFAGVSKIPLHLNHVKKMSAFDMEAATKASEKIAGFPLTIRDDIHELSAICAMARQMRNKVELIVIDYAQLIKVHGQKERRLEVEKVSRDLRLLAMELGVPIILLCQLNKDGETRESKSLEMDATACWQLDEHEDNKNIRVLSIPWQRNGESKIVRTVTFLGHIARIEDYAEKQPF